MQEELCWSVFRDFDLSLGRDLDRHDSTVSAPQSRLRLKRAICRLMGCYSSKATVHPLSSPDEASSGNVQAQLVGSRLRTSAAERSERELPSADQKVVYFAGQKGKGKVEWEALATSDLWDGIGLGGSQKSEVAFLDRMRQKDPAWDYEEA
eukprot:g25800.t1